MGMEIVNFVKGSNGNISAMTVENLLYHLKSPKLLISIIGTTSNGQSNYQNESRPTNGKYAAAHAFIDVDEAVQLMHNIRLAMHTDLENLLDSYKGGVDKKFNNQTISRVLHVKHSGDRFLFTIEIMDGEQSFAINKKNERVPGIVKPKRGGKTYIRNSFSLNPEEALYCATMIDKELTAWRTVHNFLYYKHPENYQRQGSENN